MEGLHSALWMEGNPFQREISVAFSLWLRSSKVFSGQRSHPDPFRPQFVRLAVYSIAWRWSHFRHRCLQHTNTLILPRGREHLECASLFHFCVVSQQNSKAKSFGCSVPSHLSWLYMPLRRRVVYPANSPRFYRKGRDSEGVCGSSSNGLFVLRSLTSESLRISLSPQPNSSSLWMRSFSLSTTRFFSIQAAETANTSATTCRKWRVRVKTW